jgi:hypothetical protein
MKLFECQNCGQLLYFENTRCESCGYRLGYLPARETVTAVEPDGNLWRALAEPAGRYKFCANAEYDACNWLIGAKNVENFCAACRHNRNIPDLTIFENLTRWRRIEAAKHRLFYTILKLRLPLITRADDPDDGLAFDFLSSDAPIPGHGGMAPVMTGHANGLITLNIAEADDVERERQRTQMGEPYRTLLGHFRHEIAHYYWDRLIANSPTLEEFRTVFGDEREDYSAALQRHYTNGPPPDWPEHYVTAYASSHPWEDFAETWAHYFHMVDTLETARAFGLTVNPRVAKGADLATKIDFDPHNSTMERIIESWLPLTFAMNSINRSMGLADLYPFVLPPPVIVKLTFLHDRIHSQGRKPIPAAGLRAIVARLRQNVGATNTSSSTN